MKARLIAISLIAGSAMVLSLPTAPSVGAQAVDATLNQDFVSNTSASGEDNTVLVTVTDVARDTSGSPDTIVSTATVIKNLTAADTVNLLLTETGIFTGTFTVISTASTGTSIQASDGDQIQVLYERGDGAKLAAITPSAAAAVIVDAIGPTITNRSPADGVTSNSINQTFQAQVSDSGSGVGTDPSAVKSNVVITVSAEDFAPVVTDLGSGSWRVEVSLFLSETTHTWHVTAKDVLGNTTVSPTFTVVIDTTAVPIPAVSYLGLVLMAFLIAVTLLWRLRRNVSRAA